MGLIVRDSHKTNLVSVVVVGGRVTCEVTTCVAPGCVTVETEPDTLIITSTTVFVTVTGVPLIVTTAVESCTCVNVWVAVAVAVAVCVWVWRSVVPDTIVSMMVLIRVTSLEMVVSCPWMVVGIKTVEMIVVGR